MVSDTLISESIKSCNMANNIIKNIKCNYYFVFYYIYSLLLQSPKLDVIYIQLYKCKK